MRLRNIPGVVWYRIAVLALLCAILYEAHQARIDAADASAGASEAASNAEDASAEATAAKEAIESLLRRR